MPRCGTGLTDLPELGHKGKDALILLGLIVEGLAAGKKGVGIAQRILEERFGIGHMGSAAEVFLVQPAPATKSNLAFDEWFGHRRKTEASCAESTFASRIDRQILQRGLACGVGGEKPQRVAVERTCSRHRALFREMEKDCDDG